MDFLGNVVKKDERTTAEKQLRPVLCDENIQVLSSLELNSVASLTWNDPTLDGIFEFIETICTNPMDYTALTIQKALIVTKHIVVYGSEKTVNHAYGLRARVQPLLEFNTVLMTQRQGGAMSWMQSFQGGAVDKGGPVREAAQQLLYLLGNINELRALRLKSASEESLVPVGKNGEVAFVTDEARRKILQRKLAEQNRIKIQSNLKRSEGGFGGGYASKDGRAVVGAAHGIEEMIKMANRHPKSSKFSDDGKPKQKTEEELILEELKAEADAEKAERAAEAARTAAASNSTDFLGSFAPSPMVAPTGGGGGGGVDLLDFGGSSNSLAHTGGVATGDLLGGGMPPASATGDLLGVGMPPASATGDLLGGGMAPASATGDLLGGGMPPASATGDLLGGGMAPASATGDLLAGGMAPASTASSADPFGLAQAYNYNLKPIPAVAPNNLAATSLLDFSLQNDPFDPSATAPNPALSGVDAMGLMGMTVGNANTTNVSTNSNPLMSMMTPATATQQQQLQDATGTMNNLASGLTSISLSGPTMEPMPSAMAPKPPIMGSNADRFSALDALATPAAPPTAQDAKDAEARLLGFAPASAPMGGGSSMSMGMGMGMAPPPPIPEPIGGGSSNYSSPSPMMSMGLGMAPPPPIPEPLIAPGSGKVATAYGDNENDDGGDNPWVMGGSAGMGLEPVGPQPSAPPPPPPSY